MLNLLESPVFLVFGNHEIFAGERTAELLKETKVKILRNEIVNFKGLQIIGIDYSDDKKHLSKILPKLEINKSKPAVLLYHPPASLDYINDAGINLHLAGHLHGAQIFPIHAIAKIACKSSFKIPNYKGLHKKENSYLYISSGAGTWGPPMRLFSKSEITLAKLVPYSSHSSAVIR